MKTLTNLIIPEFFNTSNLSGRELRKEQYKAGSENSLILAYFRSLPAGDNKTPSQVMEHFNRWPIWVVRRTITTLTKRGYLVKTDIQRLSPWNGREFAWRKIN